MAVKRVLAVIPGLLIALFGWQRGGSGSTYWVIAGVLVMILLAGLLDLQERAKKAAALAAAAAAETAAASQKAAREREEIDSILRKY